MGGGAIAMIPGGQTPTSVTLLGSTVTANSASTGGGLLSIGGFAIFDSIVAGNSATKSADVSGAFTDQGHEHARAVADIDLHVASLAARG